MGNRATIEVVGDTALYNKAPCYIYVHWSGSPETVTKLVKNAAPVMRKTDVSYATARLISEICNSIEGGLSVGVYPAAENNKEAWDNGHYVVDISNGNIKNNNKLVADNIAFGDF
jgi:hypothetical protein